MYLDEERENRHDSDKDRLTETHDSRGDPISDDINNLEQKIEMAKKDISSPKRGESLGRAASMYTSSIYMIIEFIVAIIIGSALGWFLDTLFSSFPLIFIVGIFMGFCAGIRCIFRTAGLL